VMRQHPQTRHVVLDAVAISDIDFTALATLSQITRDFEGDHISLSLARANGVVRAALARTSDKALERIKFYDSVDAAASHAAKTKTA